MSKAYICDKCGVIVPADGRIHGIWITSPHFKQDMEPDMHLCGTCYSQFESEYLANKRECGGA